MSSIQQITTAVMDWAAAQIPALSTYATPPEQRTQVFPDAYCEMQDVEVSVDPGGEFPQLRLEQTACRVYRMEIVLSVDPARGDAGALDLFGFVDTLQEAAAIGATVAGATISPLSSADFRPPFVVEYPDGTRARPAVLRVACAEPYDVE